ncbi:MAG TPA: NAD-dependent epimerase/dehydratase family protein, partial [Xanthobacteraceae bacterium]|nr:NAD-dependent epimerase/dehydratase family protein [Xanthobacteraceae bacterium]
MKVLVTGASGMIGRPLTAALADAGHQVRAAVRRAQTFPEGIAVAQIGDLAGDIDWSPLLAGIDAVVHLAGIAHVGTGVAESTYDRVNHLATAALARAAATAAIKRFVFVSSIRAQSGTHADHPLSESDPPLPTEAYGRSKLAAEHAVRASGVPYTILRPVLVYGRGAKGNLASLLRLVCMPVPLPFGRLANKRSLLGVDNLIAAVRFALETERAANETFMVSDPNAVSVAEIVAICRAATGRRPDLLPVPPRLFAGLFALAGQRDTWNRLAGSLEAPPK